MPYLQSNSPNWESQWSPGGGRACHGDRGVTGAETKISVQPPWSYPQATRALLLTLLLFSRDCPQVMENKCKMQAPPMWTYPRWWGIGWGRNSLSFCLCTYIISSILPLGLQKSNIYYLALYSSVTLVEIQSNFHPQQSHIDNEGFFFSQET